MGAAKKRSRREEPSVARDASSENAHVASPVRGCRLGWIAVLGLTVVLTYLPGMRGEFLLDDTAHIRDNPLIHQLWPPSYLWRPTPGTDVGARPLVALTIAVNYAISGNSSWSYHMVNRLIHLASVLLLFALLRRALTSARVPDALRRRAVAAAFVAALFWGVHPLGSQPVLYVIQRAELLFGCFALLTLYCVHRAADVSSSGRWVLAAVAACAVGALAKPVMVIVPVVALVYDRAFLSSSFLQAVRNRASLYGGLAVTWGVAWGLQAVARPDVQAKAGFGYTQISPLEYLWTQFGVVLHYLRLAVWPVGLCFDYKGWPVVQRLSEVAGPAAVVCVGLAGLVWVFRRWPWLGFWGALAVLVLLPTSSVIPIADVAVEHRMYLPLAGVVAFLVVAGSIAWIRIPCSERVRRAAAVVGVMMVSGGLIAGTVQRTQVYQSNVRMWEDVVKKRPDNPRAWLSLGHAYREIGDISKAVEAYKRVVRLRPDVAAGYDWLGIGLFDAGRDDEALDVWRQALSLDPGDVNASMHLGMALAELGRDQEALDVLNEAARIDRRALQMLSEIAARLQAIGAAQRAERYLEAINSLSGR